MKVLVIGAGGKQGKSYISMLSYLGLNMSGFVDENIESIKTISDMFELPIPTYSSIDEAILRADFDVAVLCVPHDLHFDYCKKLLL